MFHFGGGPKFYSVTENKLFVLPLVVEYIHGCSFYEIRRANKKWGEIMPREKMERKSLVGRESGKSCWSDQMLEQ